LSSASTSGPAGDLDVHQLQADETHVMEGDGAQVRVLDVGAPGK
jgi:hypothetical protein